MSTWSFRRLVSASAFSALLVGASSCSIVAPSRQIVYVNTYPLGAEVRINGEFVGASPVQYSVPRNRSNSIMVTLDGYHPTVRQTNTRLSTTGVLDIVGGVLILVPFFGLLAPGAYSQDMRYITIALAEDRRQQIPAQSR